MNNIMENEIERRNIEKYNETMRNEREEGRAEIVVKMFNNGVDAATIARLTEIPLERVNEILAERL